MESAVISLANVSKAYRTDEVETLALADVSVSVRSSEFVSITGPSGCGKTTLMNVSGLLDYPDRGEVRILGENVSRGGERRLTSLRRGTIGFIFQSFNLIENLSVRENVEMPLTYLGIHRRERRDRALAVLERVGLTNRAEHRPSQLSGGQQQRTAIARALVLAPKLILADEPTGNLDSENGRIIMAMLQALVADGTAVVVVTHTPELAALTDRELVMRDGQIVDEVRRAA